MCLDSASGGQVLIYPCYEDAANNLNQVWHIEKDRLVWHRPEMPLAVDFQAVPPPSKLDDGNFYLKTCAGKKGQRIRKHDVKADRSFLLRDEDTNECVGQAHTQRNLVHLGPCDAAHRFMEASQNSIRILGGDLCLDANDWKQAHMERCHGGQTQRFKVDEKNGWVKVIHAWGDNGRHRDFERCLDNKPEAPIIVSVQPCDATVARGVRWTRINSREPLEGALWRNAIKPAPNAPILGGDAEPPE